MSNDGGSSSSSLAPVVVGLAVGVAFILLFSFIFSDSNNNPFLHADLNLQQPHYADSNRQPQTEEEFYRNSLLPGHSLTILVSPSPPTNVTSIDVANPTGSHSFRDCKVIQEIFTPFYENDLLQQQQQQQQQQYQKNNTVQQEQTPLNVTLRTYQSIPPHFIDHFDAPLVPEVLEKNYLDNIRSSSKSNSSFSSSTFPMSFKEYADRIAGRSWFILECSKPSNESIAFPWVTIGGGINAIMYHPGDTITVRGIVGYHEVTIRVLGPGIRTPLINETKIKTSDDGGSFVYSFTLPKDANKHGIEWTVQVEMPNGSMIGSDILVK